MKTFLLFLAFDILFESFDQNTIWELRFSTSILLH